MIELPFPPPQLSPNARVHWAVKHREAKTYKTMCILLLLRHRKALEGKTSFALTFRPPSARRSDIDNMLAAFKHGLDGLSTVTGVDDSAFSLTIAKGKPVKGGKVIVACK
jgi:crossover junction endodeoxyribonuclease RusA